MPTINMRSAATLVKGQGVASCYQEQVRLVTEGLDSSFKVYINSMKHCDVAHYHTVNPNYYLESKLNKNKNASIGYVHFLPDTLEESLEMPKLFRSVFNKYLLSFYNSMDYLVVVNPKIKSKLLQYGVTHPKICYIPNFVSDKDFYPQPEDVIAQTKKIYGIPQDKFVVLGAGQLQRRKGVMDFIETAKKLPNVQFVWAGGFSFGIMSDGYDEIKALKDNPPDNVMFLGIIDRSKMVDIYNASDLLFLPSYDELFPMAILEAQCCRKAVMLRDVDVYPEILFDSYLKGKAVEDFAENINELIRDPGKLEYWAGKAWECHGFYTESSVLNMWKSLYEEAYHKTCRNDEVFTEGF